MEWETCRRQKKEQTGDTCRSQTFRHIGGRGGIDKHGALLRIVTPNVASKGSSVVDEAAAKTYVVLLPCPEGHPPPSEEDKQTVTEHLAPAAAEAEKQAEPAPMLLMRRKGDDDDDDMFGEALERKEALARKAAAEVLALLPPRTGLMDRLLVYLGGFNLAA